MAKRSVIGYVAVVAAITLVVGSIALRPPERVVATETSLDEPAQSQPSDDQPDLEYVARSLGWTVEEAERHAEAAKVLDAIAFKIAANTPDVFVGTALGARPDEPPSVYIKGPADKSLRTLIESAASPIVVVDNQPYSRAELEERKKRVHSALVARGVADLATSYDIQERGRISVVVSVTADPRTTEAELRSALPSDLRDLVLLRLIDGPVDEPQSAAFGGMYGTRSGSNRCLFAWSVRSQATGAYGVVTASVAHCDGGAVMDGIRHPGVGIHSATYQYPDHWGYWGEYAWYKTSVPEQASFYATDTQIRAVNSVEHWAELSVNELVCIYSRVRSDRLCGQVKNPSMACSLMDHIVQMKQNMMLSATAAAAGLLTTGRTAFTMESAAT